MLTSLGAVTFEVISALVDGIALVEDARIREAMAFLFDRLKLVTEPSGAITTAALLGGNDALRGKRIGVIISGGNVGVDRFREILDAHAGPARPSSARDAPAQTLTPHQAASRP